MNLEEKFKELSTEAKIDVIRSIRNHYYADALNTLTGTISWCTYAPGKSYTFKDVNIFKEKYKNNILYKVIYKEDKNNVFLYSNDFFSVYVEKYQELDSDANVSFIVKGVENISKLTDFISEEFDEIKEEETTPKILLLRHNNSGYYTTSHEIKDVSDLNLEDNYNDGFLDVHHSILNILHYKNNSMIILQGLPGTGKTTYGRYLSSCLLKSDKKVLFLPSNLIHVLAQPDFLSTLNLFKDKIVLIEDAEEILIKKEHRNQAVSNILNLTDGILADIFNIHFIFTFNIDVNQIDPALLRKGRLNLMYEFKPLTKDKYKNLCTKLNRDFDNDKEFTLANIYNTEENILSSKETKSIGFN